MELLSIEPGAGMSLTLSASRCSLPHLRHCGMVLATAVHHVSIFLQVSSNACAPVCRLVTRRWKSLTTGMIQQAAWSWPMVAIRSRAQTGSPSGRISCRRLSQICEMSCARRVCSRLNKKRRPDKHWRACRRLRKSCQNKHRCGLHAAFLHTVESLDAARLTLCSQFDESVFQHCVWRSSSVWHVLHMLNPNSRS